MSDSLYKSEERSRIRPKVKGVLQFGASTLTRDAKGMETIDRKSDLTDSNLPLQLIMSEESAP